MIIGVISDTHGRISKKALEALKGSKLIIHAGDVGGTKVLEALEEIAPVYAVRGNTDLGRWAQALPKTQVVELGDMSFYVLHNLEMLSIDPKSAGFDGVIYGHTHIPKEERQDGVLYFNPGSAGPKRFRLPICLGRILVKNGEIDVEWIDLEGK
ncbi:MAG: metallophosphoesterase family protein [Clostridiales bacterium]|nr:metallophosphoesterase family protein [Clostridiales bacterium]